MLKKKNKTNINKPFYTTTIFSFNTKVANIGTWGPKKHLEKVEKFGVSIL